MKICFVRLSDSLIEKKRHPSNVEPDFSIGYSASILRKRGHEIKLIDCAAYEYNTATLKEEIEKFKPDILVIRFTIPTLNLLLEVAKSAKKERPIICTYGPGGNNLIKSILKKDSGVDIILLGEIEKALEELVAKIEKKLSLRNIRGIAYYRNQIIINKKRDLITNLNTLPSPDYPLFLLPNYKIFYPVDIHKRAVWGHMLTSRGCKNKCSFCSLRVSYGSRYRTFSVGRITSELEYLTKKGVNVINFLDDNFVFDRKRMVDICNGIIRKGIKIKWIAQARADCLDRELLQIMKKAGCSTLCIGVESGSERILKIIKKGETKSQISKAFRLCKNSGILTVAYFIIGNPTEREEDIRDSINFCKELNADMVQVHFFTPYPNNNYYNKLSEKEKTRFSDFSHYKTVVHNFSKIPTQKLLNYRIKFYKQFYFRPNFIFRLLLIRLPYTLFNLSTELNFFKELVKFYFIK